MTSWTAIDVVDELAESVPDVRVVAFLLDTDVADCLNNGTDELPVYALSTLPILSSLVEIFRQCVEKAGGEWAAEHCSALGDLGSFDDALSPILVYNRLLLPVDYKYLEYLVHPWQDTYIEYLYHHILEEARERRARSWLKRWATVTGASKTVRKAVIEWASRPEGPLAVVAKRDFAR